MQHKTIVLSQHIEFGSVTRCLHGCLHIHLGHTTFTLSEDQYFRFVAMINESAANYEYFQAGPADEGRLDPIH